MSAKDQPARQRFVRSMISMPHHPLCAFVGGYDVQCNCCKRDACVAFIDAICQIQLNRAACRQRAFENARRRYEASIAPGGVYVGAIEMMFSVQHEVCVDKLLKECGL